MRGESSIQVREPRDYSMSSRISSLLLIDFKPDKILVNYGDNGSRFGDAMLADLEIAPMLIPWLKSMSLEPLSLEALKGCLVSSGVHRQIFGLWELR